MDAQQPAALSQAIQAFASALENSPPPLAASAAPVAAAPPAPTQVSPYEGGALELLSHTGTSLFHTGANDLETQFSSKMDNLHVFLNDLRDIARMFYWIGGANSVLTIQVRGQSLKLLDHYGQILAADSEAA